MRSISRRTMLFSLGSAMAAAQPRARRPNIVLILTDDQGWWDVGVHGNKDIETPQMDRLAAEGVEFTHFYVSPVCAPTRASLMTGRHYLRTGIYNTRFGGDTMRAEETTIAEVLRKAGYKTAIFGKWHLGQHQGYQAYQRGFDEALTFSHGHVERLYYPDRLTRNGRRVDARGYMTDILTDSAIQFVKQNRGGPFFLYVAYNVPHEPHIIDDTHLQKYMRKGLSLREARIYGMITQCDANIGRLLGAIDSAGIREDTVVFFLSDNGGISRHFTAGLRGAKGSAYEGGVRAPFFARWPGRFPAGARTDSMACHIDLFPTMCELAGVRLESGIIDGKSVLPILRTGRGASPHDYVFHIWDRFRPSLESKWSIGDGKYKLVNSELFDLQSDPGERKDISKEKPEIAAKLRGRFVEWFQDVTRGRTFEPVPIQVGREDENPVEIQASWSLIDGTETNMTHPYHREPSAAEPLPGASGHSTVNYTFAGYDWDTIDGWSKPGERARWRIEVVRAGEYEVTLAYGCNPQDAGGTFRLSIGGSHLDGVVASTGNRDIFEARPLGTLALAKGAAEIQITAVQVAGRELMALNRLWLRRL